MLSPFNPLLHMPISNSAANKDIMSKIWTNGDTVIYLVKQHSGKGRNCSLRAISFFFHNVFKCCLLLMCQNEYLWSKWLTLHKLISACGILSGGTGRLAQLVGRRTHEHNVSGLYRCGLESPAGQLKLLIVFRMRR